MNSFIKRIERDDLKEQKQVRTHTPEDLEKIKSQWEQKPVAWVIEDGEVDYYVDVVAKIKPGTPLYTAPPKREWVGLKGDEISECWKTGDVVAAVEAKLKEKNRG